MSNTALGLLISASLYAGFQLTIRMLVYPQLANVGTAEFRAYEGRHQRLVARIVGPLFAALVVTTVAVVIRPPTSASWWQVVTPVVLAAVILGATGFLAVPLHRRLGRGFDADAHRRLLAVDAVRLAAALLDVVAAAILLRS